MTAPLTAQQSQRVFRAVLDVLSRPGTVSRLPESTAPSALLPVLALADLETPVCVEGGEWADVVRTVTSAPSAGRGQARLAVVLEPLDELSGFRTGSSAAPEDGALVCLSVSELGEGAEYRLSGPGVPGERTLRITGLPPDFAAQRERLAGEFPAGIDLVLATKDGRITGLPRSTRVEGGV
ncbi:phosphonate C-P lyase system protein PhnH [Saccharopolyspora taberi]|uniref:Phosphonate C-P lyase system protein PhnH n=1 Tax=Saccharopolyspora taberi TaxID=60895 RepID=A0ABN3V4A8_9PSEU